MNKPHYAMLYKLTKVHAPLIVCVPQHMDILSFILTHLYCACICLLPSLIQNVFRWPSWLTQVWREQVPSRPLRWVMRRGGSEISNFPPPSPEVVKDGSMYAWIKVSNSMGDENRSPQWRRPSMPKEESNELLQFSTVASFIPFLNWHRRLRLYTICWAGIT
jgi:hypothetical protein